MTKQPHELALMAESGRLLASVFEMLDRTPLIGMSTLEVDTLVDRFKIFFCGEFFGQNRLPHNLDWITLLVFFNLVLRPIFSWIRH